MKIEFAEHLDDQGRVYVSGIITIQQGVAISGQGLNDPRLDLREQVRQEIRNEIDRLIYGDARQSLIALRQELSRMPLSPFGENGYIDRVSGLLDKLAGQMYLERTAETETLRGIARHEKEHLGAG